MINKFHIQKKTLFIVAFLLSSSLKSQGPPYVAPYNIPSTIVSGNFSSGSQYLTAPKGELNTLITNGTSICDVTGNYYLDFKPGCHVGAYSSNGNFHGHIQQSPIEVVSYHPNGFSGIPQYDKFELGIKLPPLLQNRIDNFFGNSNVVSGHPNTFTCTNGYGNQFNGPPSYPNNINPYDPDQISVEAKFDFIPALGEQDHPDQIVYGFYYREYNYSTGDPEITMPKYTTTNWIENTNLQHHWRVRFAPKYVGNYVVTWIIKGPTFNTLIDNAGQAFSTIPSSNEGFVKIGSNVNFLVTQRNNSDPQKTILPIGVVYAGPPDALPNTAPDHILDTGDDIPSSDAPDWGGNQNLFNFCFPSRYYRHRKITKENIAEKGGNIVRIFCQPWTFDIEYEKAGVYDASPTKPLATGIPPLQWQQYYKGVNRQAIMWELDRYLDMAAENNLYLQWVIDDITNGYRLNDMDNKGDWPVNPYTQVIPNFNPNSNQQFFTDETAKKLYKNRLRYIFSRYGYSTNILAFEIMNEFPIIGEHLPGTTVDAIFKPFLQEILNYIKGPYPSLNHTDHLCTASTTDWESQGDDVLNIANLDFISHHPYINTNRNSFKLAYDNTLLFKAYHHKPTQAGELGILPGYTCNSSNIFMEFLAPTFHTLLWSTTFNGGLTSGLDNWDGGLTTNPNIHLPCGDAFPQYFKPLKEFIKNIDFNGDSYVPKYAQNYFAIPMPPPKQQLESFYLVDNLGVNCNNIIGYTRNRTFWAANFVNSNNTQYFSQGALDKLINSGGGCNYGYIDGITWTGNLGSITVEGIEPLSLYEVRWYDTYKDPDFEDPFISSTGLISFSNVGILDPPNFEGCSRQEYGFKIKKIGAKINPDYAMNDPIYLDSISKTYNIPKEKLLKSVSNYASVSINISPNPTRGICNIVTSKNDKYVVEVKNYLGSLLKDLSFTGTQQTVNIEDLANGVYMFVIKGSNGATFTQKVIKE